MLEYQCLKVGARKFLFPVNCLSTPVASPELVLIPVLFRTSTERTCCVTLEIPQEHKQQNSPLLDTS